MKGYDAKFLDELKSKNSLEEVVSQYIPLEQRGTNFWGRCPFHHEKTASFCVNSLDQFYYCFGCHKSGDVISFIQEIESLDFAEAVKFLATRAKMPLPDIDANDDKIRADKQKKETLLNILRASAHFYVENLSDERAGKHLDYIASRNLTSKDIRYFGLGASLDFEGLPKYLSKNGYNFRDMVEAGVVGEKNGRYYDSLGGRLIIPIINQFNEVIAFCGRILESKGFAKYVNTKETLVFTKGNTLFNVNNLKKLKQKQNVDSVIMVEGHMDVISLVKGGFENVVASMGTALTKNQARMIKRYAPNVIISYDGDAAGQKATIRGLEILQDEGLNVRVLSLPDGMDPDDVVTKLGSEKYKQLIDEAKPLIDFKLDVLEKSFNLNNTEDKRKFITEALKIIKKSDSISEQEDLLKIIRGKTGITYESLKRELDGLEEGVKPKIAEMSLTETGEKNLQAERFLLWAVLFSKPYAVDVDLSEIEFSEPVHIAVAEYIADCKKNGVGLKPNLLYDLIEDEDRDKLSRIFALELNKSDYNEEKYLEDCLRTLTLNRLEKEIEMLTSMCEKATDIAERQQLAKKLQEKLFEKNRFN